MSSSLAGRAGAALAALAVLAGCRSDPPAPRATTLIRGAHVFDGERDLGGVDVLIDRERIAAIGPGLAAPGGAVVVDGAGKTLVPGLIDAHVHLTLELSLEQELAFGVTTALDLMSDPAKAARLREVARTRPDRADYRSAGNPVVAPGGAGTQYRVGYQTLADGADVEAFVDQRVAEGSDYIKIVADDLRALGLPRVATLSADALGRAIARAHHHRRIAVVHVLDGGAAAAAIDAGADGLAHLFADAPADDALVARMRERRAFVIPTLTALHCLVGAGDAAALATDPALGPFLDPDDVDNLGRTAHLPPGGLTLRLANAEATLRALRDAGVPILAGTDAANPGMAYGASLHHELALLVAAGLSTAEALRAATAAPAAAFGLTDRGRIAVGLRADLVLLDGDPLADIRATRAIAAVWRGGVRYDRERWRARVAEARRSGPRRGRGLFGGGR